MWVCQKLCKEQKEKLRECADLLSDKEQLEEAVRQQHKLIDKQKDELQGIKKEMGKKESQFLDACAHIKELELETNDRSELKILFDEVWLVESKHRKVKGDVPVDRDGSTLNCVGGADRRLCRACIFYITSGKLEIDTASQTALTFSKTIDCSCSP